MPETTTIESALRAFGKLNEIRLNEEYTSWDFDAVYKGNQVLVSVRYYLKPSAGFACKVTGERQDQVAIGNTASSLEEALAIVPWAKIA